MEGVLLLGWELWWWWLGWTFWYGEVCGIAEMGFNSRVEKSG